MTPQWHVLYTRHRWEMKVAAHLAGKDLENYCPMNKGKQVKKKNAPEALFPSWVFVKTDSAALPALRQVKGVVNLVYWLGKPVAVPAAEMEALMQFVNDHQDISMERITRNAAGDAGSMHTISIASLEQYNLETLVMPSLLVSLSALVKVPMLELVNHNTVMPEMLPALRYAMS
jgi:transcription antitermination factor NusG